MDPGGCLSSRAVSSQVLSVYVGLTSVFGMRTGGSPQLNHRKVVLLYALVHGVSLARHICLGAVCCADCIAT